MVEGPQPLRAVIGFVIGWLLRHAANVPIDCPPVDWGEGHERSELEDKALGGAPDCEPLECPVCLEATYVDCSSVLSWTWERECFILGLIVAFAVVVFVAWLSSACADPEPRRQRARIIIGNQ